MKIFDNCLLSLSSSLFTLQVREKSNKKLRKAESESEEEDVIVLTKEEVSGASPKVYLLSPQVSQN